MKTLISFVLLAGIAATQPACASTDGDTNGSEDALGGTTPVAWSQEEDLPQRFKPEIVEYFFDHAKLGEFSGVDSVPIRYAEMIAPKEKAAIVVFPGRTESYIKYAEVAYDLHRRGYSLYIFDHRGQGFSGRMLPDPDKGHVQNFADYVTDAKTFIDTRVLPHGHERLFALGHSMGGAILGHYLLERPSTFLAAMFSAPMFKISTKGLGDWGVDAINFFRGDTDYIVGTGPYKEGRKNRYNHSQVRFETLYYGLEAQYPQTRLGGPTKHWFEESAKAGETLRQRASSLGMPLLLVQGALDQIVDNDGEDTVCNAAPNCKKVSLFGAGHEPLMETDEFREPAMDAILEFVTTH